MDKCLNLMKNQLRQVKEKLAYKKMGLASISNYLMLTFSCKHFIFLLQGLEANI